MEFFKKSFSPGCVCKLNCNMKNVIKSKVLILEELNILYIMYPYDLLRTYMVCRPSFFGGYWINDKAKIRKCKII